MGYHKLYTHDLARSAYTAVSSVPDAVTLSAKNAVDGDPNSIWEPGATAASWTHNHGSARVVNGYAIANHNLLGGTISFQLFIGYWWTADNVRSVVTPEDFLIDLGPLNPAATATRLVVTGPSNIKVGCISILTDYAYTAAGVLATGNGGAILSLGGDGGVGFPIPGAGDPGIVGMQGANKFMQLQRMAPSSMDFVLNLGQMKAGLNEPFWRVWNAYYPRRSDMYSNPGFSKCVWYVSDEWSLSTPQAAYCVGSPATPLQRQVDRPGGRATASLHLLTLARDSVV